MKNFLALLVAALLLGSYVYWVEIKGGREKKEEKAWSERLFQVKKENITKILIADKITLEKQKNGWRIVKPVQDIAEASAVNRLLGAIDGAKIKTELEGDSKEYGLDHPEATLTLLSGDQSVKVLLGRTDYAGQSVYARLQDHPKIFLTDLDLKLALNEDLYYWRSKTLFSLLPDDIEHVEIMRPSGKVVLSKENNSWKLVSPLQDRANNANINAILYELRYTKPLLFIDDQKDADFGLDQPLIQLTATSGEKKESFLIGKKQGENYYAYNPARTAVFMVGKDVVDKLLFSVDQLRDPILVPLSLGEIKAIEVIGQEKHFSFTEENGIWQAQGEGRVDIYPIWWHLANARIARFDVKASFDKPFVTWKITTKDGQTYRYEAVEADQGCYVRELPSKRAGFLAKENCDDLRLKPAAVQPEPGSSSP